VVHAPAIDSLKIITDVAALQGSLGAQLVVTRRIGVVVVHAKEKGVRRFPAKPQVFDLPHRAARFRRFSFHGSLLTFVYLALSLGPWKALGKELRGSNRYQGKTF
jgi:hypothetical protein